METHRIVGFKTPERLIEEAKKSNSGKNYSYYMTKYNEGERGIEFIYEFMKHLASAGKSEEVSTVASEFLNTINPKDLYKIEYWSVVRAYCNDGNSDVIKYIQTNPKVFKAIYGEQAVELKLNRAFHNTAKSFSTREGDKTTVNFKQYENYLDMLEDMKVKDVYKIKRNADMHYAVLTLNWNIYVRAVAEIIEESNGKNIGSLLWNYAMRINSLCDDMKIRKEASKWIETAIGQTKSEKSRETLKKTYLELLEPKQEKTK